MARDRRPATALSGSARGVLLTLAFGVAVIVVGTVLAAALVWLLA
jgi:hypothetical protein